MEQLKENISNAESLANALKKNGASHKNYKAYMSMERALGFLITGDLYLSDGSKWNDLVDSQVMREKCVFGRCFSYSTCENIAMWMLYGEQRGKKGAMLNFIPSVRNEILNTSIISIGKFNNKGKYEEKGQLTAAEGEFEIFFADMIYYENVNSGKVRLTLADEHCVADAKILDHKDIFAKKYPWGYEKECRLIVRLCEKWEKRKREEGLDIIKIKISERLLNRMRDNSLVRSPIYVSGAENGSPSKLVGEVDIF